MSATCTHTFCAREDHDQDPDVHEGVPALIRSVQPGSQLGVQLSYRDGDRGPVLFVADVELDPHGVAELVDVLQRRLAQMCAVQPTGQAVAR